MVFGLSSAFAQTSLVDVQQVVVPTGVANGSIAAVTQSGQFHQATIEQQASGAVPGANRASVIQDGGSSDMAIVSQTGQHDMANVVQYGSGLKAEVLQSGINLGVEIKQFGVGNGQTVSVTQTGAGLAAPVASPRP